jgi:hypothetical protein
MQTSNQNFFLLPRLPFLISIYILAITTMVLNSASPRVFAEQGYYTCYRVSDQPNLTSEYFCDPIIDNILPPICFQEGDPISLTNYFYHANNIGRNRPSPQDYPLNTSYKQIANPGDPILLPTQTQNYTYPLSVSFTQPSTTGLVEGLNGLTFTGNGTTGVDQFTYTITNSNGDSDTGRVVYKVTDSSASLLEKQAIPKTLNSRMNGSGNTYTNFGANTVTIINQPVNGTVFHNGSQFIYTPNQNYFGEDIFTYQLTDSSLVQSSIQSVNVKVYDLNASPVLALNLDNYFDVTSSTSFSISNSNIQNGQELYYLRGLNSGFDVKQEVHIYTTTAPTVTAIEGAKLLNLEFKADVTNDPEQLATPPFPVEDISLTQPIRVEHKNTPPAITNILSNFVGNSVILSGDINDAENNNFNVIFELSKDNFSTLAQTFTLSNQTSGSFNHTFSGLDFAPYSYRIRSQEVGTIPNLCNTFTNSQTQSVLSRQSSVFPVRSSGGLLYGTTSVISGSDPSPLTTVISTAPTSLIRTGGSDI